MLESMFDGKNLNENNSQVNEKSCLLLLYKIKDNITKIFANVFYMYKESILYYCNNLG